MADEYISKNLVIERLEEKKSSICPSPFCGGEVKIALIDNTETQQEWFITRGVGGNRCKCRMFMESRYFQNLDE